MRKRKLIIASAVVAGSFGVFVSTASANSVCNFGNGPMAINNGGHHEASGFDGNVCSYK